MLKQKDWINVLVEKLGCTKKDAKEYYDCVFDYMKEQISPEESIKISSFGVFKLRKTMAKEQVNIATGEIELVPEHFVVVFKPYFELEPKPKAIEFDDETAVETLDEEDDAVEIVSQEIVEDEEIEEVEEIVAPVEEAVEPTEETAPVKEEKLSDIAWVYENETYTVKDIRKVLSTKTHLDDADIIASLKIIEDSARKLVKDPKVIKIVEEKDSFNFEIEK